MHMYIESNIYTFVVRLCVCVSLYICFFSWNENKIILKYKYFRKQLILYCKLQNFNQ